MKKLFLAALLLALAPQAYGLPILPNSSGDEIRISGSNLPNEDNWSITLWIREEGTNSAVAQYAFGMSDTAPLNLVRLNLAATTPVLTYGSGAGQTTGATISTATWYFWAFTRAGTSHKIYLNGSTSANITNTSTETAGAINEITFGNRATDTTTNWCGCTFAALKMWNAVLTPEQLQNEMYSYRPRVTDNLYGWWPMVSGVLANDMADFSGGAHPFTNSGTALSAETPPISW